MPDYDRAKHLELISKAIERMDKSATSLKALSPAALGVAFLLVDKKVPAWLAVGAAAVAVGIYWLWLLKTPEC
jgi:alpha-D-ribose 1-methylphosphonate 5-triphosphate synthase subunit PhnH